MNAPDWLSELQAHFGEVLRTPLDRETGTLRATPSAYPEEALLDVVDRPEASAAERLAVYNRQYWFRLFRALAKAFPLTAHVLGHWRFNDYAARFIVARPPRGWDLEEVPNGFERFVESAFEDVEERALVLEAATLDASWRKVTRAPPASPFQPSAEDAARLLDTRLALAPGAAVLRESWNLTEVHGILIAGETMSVTRLPEPRWWALIREAEGVRRLPLAPREGELLALLRRGTVREALAALDAACDERERAGLPASVRGWLAKSAERGMWCALNRG